MWPGISAFVRLRENDMIFLVSRVRYVFDEQPLKAAYLRNPDMFSLWWNASTLDITYVKFHNVLLSQIV